MTRNNEKQVNLSQEKPLEGWKEIAAYLQRDNRTVRRWEKSERLPVRRHRHLERSSVYAYPNELDAWREQRKPVTAFTSGWLWSVPARGCTAAAALLLALLTAASGPILTPANAADGEPAEGMTTRQVWSGPEVELLGSLSPDGRYLSSVDWNTGGNLSIRDIAAGENRFLTGKTDWLSSSEYAWISIFSPDSERVAYTWFSMEKFPETGHLTYELRIINRDGSGMRRLYRNQETAYLEPHGWTPDGAQVLVLLQNLDNTYQIALVSAEDGSAQVLKTFDWRRPRNMSLSPDGKFIVYDFPPREDSPQRDIYLLEADGSREVTLVKHGAHDLNPVWTPSGNEIVFTSDRTGQPGLWKLSVQGDGRAGAPSMVKPNIGQSRPLGFTPEGAFYYGVAIGQSDVYMATLEPNASNFLSPPLPVVESYVGSNSRPDWSPDGEYLSYVSQRGPAVRGATSRVLVIRSLRTGEERELRPGIDISNRISVPRWSPDSRSLVTLGRNRKGRFDIYQIDAETGAHKMLVPSRARGGIPVRLPDGKSLILVRGHEGILSLIVRNIETGSERTLYRSRHIHAWALSPDGRQMTLAVNSEDQIRDPVEKEGVFNSNVLLVLPVNGGEAREIIRVPKNEEFQALAWTPDSRHVLYIRGTTSSESRSIRPPVWRIPASGGESLRTDLVFWPNELKSFRYHPDGRRLIYNTAGWGPEGAPSKEIWVLENFLPKSEVAQAEQ